MEDEARHSREYDTYYIIEPELKFWNQNDESRGRKLDEGFRYASNTNPSWLSIDDLKRMIPMAEPTISK